MVQYWFMERNYRNCRKILDAENAWHEEEDDEKINM